MREENKKQKKEEQRKTGLFQFSDEKLLLIFGEGAFCMLEV